VSEIAPGRADDATLAGLRACLVEAGYTTDRVEKILGVGRISFRATDVAVHARRLPPGEPFSALAGLFLLGLPLATADAEAAIGPVGLSRLERAGVLQGVDGAVRAAFKLIPHGDLLIASDRDGEPSTAHDWVAGIHPPSVTLAKLTVRRPVTGALDLGTGNGIQALLASRHAERVIATDVNPRALDFARFNARLNGVSNIEFRQGSFFEPVEGERFDLIVSNPPYVISPESRYAYRDSGLAGDGCARHVVESAPAFLAEGGYAHLLVSWAHPAEGGWRAPLERWVAGRNCDALLLHFGSDDPVTHAASWLEPLAGENGPAFEDALGRWLAYLEGLGIGAIAYGAVILRRRSIGGNWTRGEHVPLDRVEQASDHVLRVFGSHDRLEGLEDERSLLDAHLALVEASHLEQTLVCRDGGLQLRDTLLLLDEGLGSRIGLDLHTARLLPLLNGHRSLREALAERAAEMGLGEEDAARFADAGLPALRRLFELGFLAHVP